MFNEEKHLDTDDSYIAHFATTKMAGQSLRWVASLDENVQSSWHLLKQALLAQYPPYEQDLGLPS